MQTEPSPSRSHSTRTLRISSGMSLAACGLLGLACGPSLPNVPPPFVTGDSIPPSQITAYEGPLRPVIVVEEPSGAEVIRTKPNRKTNCVVTVTVPEGGTVPTFLSVSFKYGERGHANSATLQPVRRAGNVYRLKARPMAPSRPGLYQLEADGTYLVDESATTGTRARAIHVTAFGPKFQVTP